MKTILCDIVKKK